MSILGRTVSPQAIAAVAALLIFIAGLLPVMTTARAREIRLVAKDMAFYVESDLDTPNPTLEARAGETLRIVLLNRDRGVTHDFALPVLDAATGRIKWNERDEVTFQVPSQAGTYEYVCRPHLLMMKGQFIVRSADQHQ